MMHDTKKRILTYLALTFAFSAVFWVLIIRAGSIEAQGGLYTAALMWCPALAALLTTYGYQHTLKGLGWGWGKGRYQLLAYLLPLLYTAISYAIVWLTGLGALTMANLPKQYPAGAYLLIMATLGTVGSLISATGEEIGWRGLLVPELAKVTTFSKTALISGMIWTIWHTPLLLFADYNNGTPAWYGLACFVVLVIGISFAFAWLRLKSGSLWTGAILHASHNLFIQGIFDPLTRNTGITPYITGEFGIALALAAVVVAFVFWKLRPGQADAAGQEPQAAQMRFSGSH